MRANDSSWNTSSLLLPHCSQTSKKSCQSSPDPKHPPLGQPHSRCLHRSKNFPGVLRSCARAPAILVTPRMCPAPSSRCLLYYESPPGSHPEISRLKCPNWSLDFQAVELGEDLTLCPQMGGGISQSGEFSTSGSVCIENRLETQVLPQMLEKRVYFFSRKPLLTPRFWTPVGFYICWLRLTSQVPISSVCPWMLLLLLCGSKNIPFASSSPPLPLCLPPWHLLLCVRPCVVWGKGGVLLIFLCPLPASEQCTAGPSINLEDRWEGRRAGGRDKEKSGPQVQRQAPLQLGHSSCFWHILCRHFWEGQAFGDNYIKPSFLLCHSPAIPNKLYFNLRLQFTAQFIYNNTIHCDHSAINLCFK